MNKFPPQEAMIEGLAFWDKAIDGQEINTGSVYLIEEFDPLNPNLAGRRIVEYKTGSAELVKPYIQQHKDGKLQFPLRARITFALITGKSTTSVRVVEFQPLTAPAQQKAA